MVEKAQDHEYYDGLYRDQIRHRWEGVARFRALAEEASQHISGSVLDLGCGFGFLAEFVGEMYLGVDFSSVAIERAREINKNPRAEFVVADLLSFKPPHFFDTVVMLEVLEHLDDPAGAVSSVKRWAKKRILVSVPRESTPGPVHLWPTWSQGDVVRFLGPGSVSWQWRRWLFGLWKVKEDQ